MFKAALKPLLAATVGVATLSLGLNIEPAQAARLTYDFTVTLPSEALLQNNLGSSLYLGYKNLGLAEGQVYKGQFSFDDTALAVTAPNSSIFYASPNQGNLTVSFNFLGKTFTERNDSSFPSYPQVYFQQSGTSRTLIGLDFLVTLPGKGLNPTLEQPGFRISGLEKDPDGLFNDFSLGASDVTNGSPISYGIVSYGSPQYEAVPEPSGVGGILLVGGLVGLRLWRRRNQDKMSLPLDSSIDPPDSQNQL